MPLDLSFSALLMFPLGMAAAAVSDLFSMRISNRLVAFVAASFFVAAFLVQLPSDQLLTHIACAAIALAVGFGFFSLGWIGGGDAKLLAATTLWLGFGLVLPYLVYASLLGGMLTLALLLVRRWPLPRWISSILWVRRLHDPKTGVPYGIALAGAALLVYSDTAIYQLFLV